MSDPLNSGAGRDAGAETPAGRLRKTALAALCGGVIIFVFYPSLLDRARFPGMTDLVFFHLPLRADFATLAKLGLPQWNPMLHGGQPILSNPNYAAFYPPSWLFLFVAPVTAVKLLAAAHLGWGLAGSWRFARRLKCRRDAALVAAVGFVAAGACVSSLNTFNLFCALAWLPWALLWTDRALETGGRRRVVDASLASLGLAAQLLAGEPAVALTTGIAILLWCLAVGARTSRSLGLAGCIMAGAVVFSAVQLLPTLAHVTGGARSDLAVGNLVWSTSPERMLELVFPRLHGEPTLSPEGLYFGRGVHDKDHPYLLSIYSGQTLLVLAIAGLLSTGVPRRRAWILMLAAGVFLALGRHNPIYASGLSLVPPFSWVRYPEKFLLLATSAIPFAAALTWDRLLTAERGDRRRTIAAVLGVALSILVAHVGLAVGLAVAPEAAAEFVQARTPETRGEAQLAVATAFLGRSALLQAAVAAVLVALTITLRRRDKPPRWLLLAVPILAIGDLQMLHRYLNPTVAPETFLEPPAAFAPLAGKIRRLSTDQGLFLAEAARPFAAVAGESAPWIRRGVERLDPYVANLWGIAYVFNPDYDLMLTRWGREALHLFYRTAVEQGDRLPALLAAWSVDSFAARRPPATAAETASAATMEVLGIERPLPYARFVPAATVFPDLEAAQTEVTARAFDVARREALIDPSAAAGERSFTAAADVRTVARSAAGLLVDYEAAGTALLVLATTFDHAFHAEVDGIDVPTTPTALGQIAVVVPPGRGRLTLRFRQPWLAAGATISGIGLLGLGLAAARSTRRGRRPMDAAHLSGST